MAEARNDAYSTFPCTTPEHWLIASVLADQSNKLKRTWKTKNRAGSSQWKVIKYS